MTREERKRKLSRAWRKTKNAVSDYRSGHAAYTASRKNKQTPPPTEKRGPEAGIWRYDL